MKKICICILGLALLFTACTENSENTEANISDSGTASDTLDLTWYEEKAIIEQKMQNYTLESESEEISSSGQVQTLLEYSGVNLYEQPCHVILCFTNLGLIGINYHDTDGQYAKWVERIIAVYGEPTQTSDSMTLWENDPLGTGTTIYVFDMGEDIQISFFTDDTGSENTYAS